VPCPPEYYLAVIHEPFRPPARLLHAVAYCCKVNERAKSRPVRRSYPVSTLSTPSSPPQLPRFPLQRDDRARACRRGARRTARPAVARGAAKAVGAGGLGGAGRVFVRDRVALVPVWSADPHSDRMRVGGVRCRIALCRVASRFGPSWTVSSLAVRFDSILQRRLRRRRSEADEAHAGRTATARVSSARPFCRCQRCTAERRR